MTHNYDDTAILKTYAAIANGAETEDIIANLPEEPGDRVTVTLLAMIDFRRDIQNLTDSGNRRELRLRGLYMAVGVLFAATGWLISQSVAVESVSAIVALAGGVVGVAAGIMGLVR